MKVFLNDDLIDLQEARVSVTDGGFLHGAGLFETMRSHGGVVFRLDDHLDRLRASARALALPHPYERAYLRAAIDRVLDANGLAAARLRLTLTQGPLMTPESERRPTLLITATEFRPYPADSYETGVRAVVCPFFQNPTDPTCGHKTTSYYPRLLALHRAHAQQAAEALWFRADRRLAEGCVSNVFLVKGTALHTPPLATPVLAGIARRTIGQLAGGAGLELVEANLSLSDLLAADEVFLTNVIMEVLPVTRVEGHAIGGGAVGPVARRLRESFRHAIEHECRREQNGG
jgi:branched-chain amino acid aminotransferase